MVVLEIGSDKCENIFIAEQDGSSSRRKNDKIQWIH